MVIISWLYSLFGSAAEKISERGKKNVHGAWKDMLDDHDEEADPKNFSDYILRNYRRNQPDKYSDIKELKSKFGNVKDAKIPTWVKDGYARATDLAAFLAGIQSGEISEANMEESMPSDKEILRYFCGIDLAKTPASRVIVTPWITEKLKRLVQKNVGDDKKVSYGALSENGQKEARRLLSILEAKDKKDLVDEVLEKKNYEARSLRVLKALTNDKVKSLSFLIQQENKLNSSIGLGEINEGNFSVYPMLKSAIKKFMASGTETWDVKINSLKVAVPVAKLDEYLKRFSKKGKRPGNNRRGGAEGGNDPDKAQPKGDNRDAARGSNRDASQAKCPGGACRNFWSTGECKFGDKCKFKHWTPRGDKKAPHNEPGGYSPAGPRFSREDIEVLRAALLPQPQGAGYGQSPYQPWGFQGPYPFPAPWGR